MKKLFKPLILSLLLVSFILSLALPSLATENIADRNYEEGKASISVLNNLCENVYVKKPNASVSNAGGNTCSVIISYRTDIELLMYSESAWTVDLTNDIKLLQKKGTAAGILSWIYYSHPETMETSTVKETYLRQLDIIDGKNLSQSSFFESIEGKSPEVERCYTLLLQTIYTCKIQSIYEEGDSETVKAMLLAYPSTMGSACKYDAKNSDGEDASNYRAFFNNVLANVDKQRNKDNTEKELHSVFTLLYPDENYETSERLVDFKIALKTKNTVSEMNELLANTVNELLDGLKKTDKEYRNVYLSKKKNDVILALDVSNSADPVSLMPVSLWFSQFESELCSADAKDTLSEYANSLSNNGKYNDSDKESLKKITLEYTSSGGILDTSQSIERIKLELTRATARCMWFDVYRSTVNTINSYKGDHSSLLNDAKTKYETTDSKISLGERDGNSDPVSRLSKDIDEMHTLSAHSEAIGFSTTHASALSLQNANAKDISLLSSALEDAHRLSVKAQNILKPSLLSLCESYKKANVSLISNTFSDTDELRQYCKTTLSQYVSDVTPKDSDGSLDIRTFRLTVDILSQKAKALNDICGLFYNDYLSGSGRYFYDSAVAAVKNAANNSKNISEEELSANATVDILRASALEQIYSSAEGYSSFGDIPSILEASKSEITKYSNRADIKSYANSIVKKIEKIILDKIILDGKSELGTLKSTLSTKISEFKYIKDLKKEEFISALLSKYDTSIESLLSNSSATDAKATIDTSLSALNKIYEDALILEKKDCLEYSKVKLTEAYKDLNNYSDINAQKVSGILDKFNEDTALADDIQKYEEILANALTEIEKIENKLVEAQRRSKEKLLYEYSSLMEKKDFYGSASLAELENIYSRTITELGAITDIADYDKVYTLTEERIALMKTVRLDMIFTKDNLLFESEAVTPEGYEPSVNGYIGAIYSNGGIPSDVALSIMNTDSEGIIELIRKAAKEKNIFLEGEALTDLKLIRALKKCELITAIDINLGKPITGTENTYSIAMLLPETLDVSDLIGIIFVGEDGTVEFFETTTDGALLEFDTTHFSKFYLVKKGTVDLTPIIICLGLIILCEIAVIVLLLLRRRKMKADEANALSAFIAPFALSVNYRPTGGKSIVSIMGIAAISMAALIAYLLYLEHMETKKQRVLTTNKKSSDSLSPVPVGINEPQDFTEEAPMIAPDGLSEQTPIEVPIKKSETEPMASISVTEAEEIMGDVKIDDLYSQDYEDLEIYYGERKGQINIDTISVFFEDGDTVTLNSLKEKRLISSNIGSVKILARGILDKRLTIVAQDFSASAVKMIHLTGGKAVLTHPSPQRNGKTGKIDKK